MLKIAFTGPESTGKTVLARTLAQQHQTLWNPEYARFYLSRNSDKPYDSSDIQTIAAGQLAWEDLWAKQANNILFCDTGTLVPLIWHEYKYGYAPSTMVQSFKERHYDLWVLCGIDIPWTYDPLREHPNERHDLYALYKEKLISASKPFLEVSGSLENRLQEINKYLRLHGFPY